MDTAGQLPGRGTHRRKVCACWSTDAADRTILDTVLRVGCRRADLARVAGAFCASPTRLLARTCSAMRRSRHGGRITAVYRTAIKSGRMHGGAGAETQQERRFYRLLAATHWQLTGRGFGIRSGCGNCGTLTNGLSPEHTRPLTVC